MVSWLEETMEINSPLGRYAISGIGDLTSRLAADQRFKLASTRAVFAPTGDSLDGLSALLLALSSSGAPSLHITSTKGDIMEELATIVLGSRCSLKISNCQVPDGGGWWQVFTDTFLTVHACRRDPDDHDKVTYLFSVHSGSSCSTLVLLPHGCDSIRNAYEELVGDDLPVSNKNNNHPVTISALIALDPHDAEWETVQLPNCVVMVTKPQLLVADPGILERSQRVVEYLSNELPQSFVLSQPRHHQDAAAANVNRGSGLEMLAPVPFQLVSGTSVLLAESPRGIDRRRPLEVKPREEDWTSTIASLRAFQEPTVDSCSLPSDGDENEIDLEEDECNNEETGKEGGGCSTSIDPIRSPMLVVLGTGCATPSAVRGASAHALTLPSRDGSLQSDMILLDCGEGVTTMMLRYGPQDWQRRIRGVWISHAHLDHYGGLATLIRNLGSSSDSSRTAHAKRRKTIPFPCCWVMAPPKILRYLDLSLNCHHGRHNLTGNVIFEPLLHQDPTTPPGPWTYFQNIKVAHNCHPAYGLLVGWPKGGPTENHHHHHDHHHHPMSWFCFSGDTRPSNSLVRACRGVVRRRRRGGGDTLFLLHEATFEDDDQEQAELKRHSTVSEAMSIAKDVGATRLLLTHFSQRYVSIQHGRPDSSWDGDCRLGLAMDGLRVMLD
jgi:ribonuclease BN (tRNA processing enzyme)